MALLLYARKFVTTTYIKAQKFIVNSILGRKTESGDLRYCEDGVIREIEG